MDILELLKADKARLEEAEDVVLRVNVEMLLDHDGFSNDTSRANRVAVAVDRVKISARDGSPLDAV